MTSIVFTVDIKNGKLHFATDVQQDSNYNLKEIVFAKALQEAGVYVGHKLQDGCSPQRQDELNAIAERTARDVIENWP